MNCILAGKGAVCKMLETKDLVLDKARMSDWKDMYCNVWSRLECARYMAWRVAENESEAVERMKKTIEYQKNHDTYLIYEKACMRAIGFAGVEKIAPDVYAETGICLGADYFGRGYGSQVVLCLIEYCKGQGAREFGYSAREGNVAANRLAVSLGFITVGIEEKTDRRNGLKYKLVKYRLEL